jgi:MULE transposase-like protein
MDRPVRYLNENPDIIILDCTYKTNKFGMPMLDILGVDGLNQGFTVGVCFMDKESGFDYLWAITHLRSLFREGIWPSVIATDCDEALMSAIESTFPAAHCNTVLCYWHVSMNVVTNCKKFFETEEAWEPFLRGFKA